MKASTVRGFVERILPNGSLNRASGGELDKWAVLPLSPIDVFAVIATLVERSGAYRQVVSPSPDHSEPFRDVFDLIDLRSSDRWSKISRAWGAGFHPARRPDSKEPADIVSKAGAQYPEKTDVERVAFASAFGREYMSFSDLGAVVVSPLQALWSEVVNTHGTCDILCDTEQADWWKPAVWLLILSDMACEGVGFWPRRRDALQSNATYIQQLVLDQAAARAKAVRDDTGLGHGMLTTLAGELVDPSFCAVLPKTRTSALGCTLRSLTHNLALLPSPGLVEARWRVPSAPPVRPFLRNATSAENEGSKPLNLLLVPFPYRFGSKCFVPDIAAARPNGNQWAYFNLEQRWLHRDGKCPDEVERSPSELLEFVRSLLEKAKADTNEIHAVVFPEYALNRSTFDVLSRALFKSDPTLEYIISGLSEEPIKRGAGGVPPKRGNFAAVRARPEQDTSDVWTGDHSRGKHHRWKIDGRQAERYGLSNRLDPKTNWWEGIPLGKRVVDFFVPRAGTAMTVLICEDLARADPVQTVVRSIGPNLIVALLMDGPQRKSRWPGHYAGVLADDPGCSVLTFTSLALIARGMTSDTDQSRSVAFFKNSLGVERELFLPHGAHALALRLSAQAKEEHSLDGRSDGGSAFIWELQEVTPVRGDIDSAMSWIVEGST